MRKYFSFHVGDFMSVPLYVNWLTVALLAFIVYFDPLQALLLLGVYVSIIPHEYGHVLAARHYGVKTHAVHLLPFGGIAIMDPLPNNPNTEYWVSFAGPLVNMGIAVMILPLCWLSVFMPEWVTLALNYALIINTGLFIFNLLPILPMDGGCILRALLSVYYSYQVATRWCVYLSYALTSIFFLVGLFFGLPLLCITMLIIAVMAYAEHSRVMQHVSS